MPELCPWAKTEATVAVKNIATDPGKVAVEVDDQSVGIYLHKQVRDGHWWFVPVEHEDLGGFRDPIEAFRAVVRTTLDPDVTIRCPACHGTGSVPVER